MIKLAFINYVSTFQINCGLAYIMTVVGKKYPVRLYDINSVKGSFEDHLRSVLPEYDPDFICFNVNSFSMGGALFWSRLCRSLCSRAKVIYGGVHPTIVPEQTIKYGEVDYVCIGEGEETIVDFLRAYENDAESIVPGIWKKDISGNIIKSSLRPYITDIDSLPMLNLDYWDMKLYLGDHGGFGRGLGIISSRGCPSHYSCNFCSAPALRRNVPGRYFRLRSPSSVAEEIDFHYKRYKHLGIRHLHFDDTCFGYNIGHLEALVVELRKRGFPYGLPLTCQTHPAVISKEWAGLVRSIGCYHVSVGIESGDEKIRINVHNKRITNKQIKEMSNNLKEANMLSSFYMILGAPQETWLSAFRTIIMLLKTSQARLLVSFFTPLPGSKLMDKYKLDIPYTKEDAFNSFCSRPAFLVCAYVSCKAAMFIKNGLRLRSGKFFIDIIKYVLNLNGIRSFPLFSRPVLAELYRKTIIQYEIRADNK